MSKNKTVRAWKDEDFRDSLSPEERAELPESPAGAIELSDDELADVVGGNKPHTYSKTWCGSCKWLTLDCCGGATKTCCCLSHHAVD